MKRRRVRKRKKSSLDIILRLSAIILFCTTIYGIWYSSSNKTGLVDFLVPTKKVEEVDTKQMYLTKNEYSRPGEELKKVKGVVVHYTANPGTTAENNRHYFEGLKDSHVTYASSHFIVGLEGEVVQCIPLDEIAYASNERNEDTISIEVCHEDESGEFNEKTYQSLIKLIAWLCGEYNLKQKDIIRHYDITGKLCPKYYVEHEDAWIQLKSQIFAYIEKFGN